LGALKHQFIHYITIKMALVLFAFGSLQSICRRPWNHFVTSWRQSVCLFVF
jgi:hypothetical protein